MLVVFVEYGSTKPLSVVSLNVRGIPDSVKKKSNVLILFCKRSTADFYLSSGNAVRELGCFGGYIEEIPFTLSHGSLYLAGSDILVGRDSREYGRNSVFR